jgi:hypothetical protein
MHLAKPLCLKVRIRARTVTYTVSGVNFVTKQLKGVAKLCVKLLSGVPHGGEAAALSRPIFSKGFDHAS